MSEKDRRENTTAVSPSDLFSKERTELSIERTKLANDRTFLSFIRTSLAFFVAAAALIRFFDQSRSLEILAYIAISLGIIVFLIGCYSYYRAKKSIKVMKRNSEKWEEYSG